MAYTQWRQHPACFAHMRANRSHVIVALEGEVDRTVARSTLRRFLSHALTCLGAPEVTVDLTEVGTMDAAGMDELRFACWQARDTGKSVLLLAATPLALLLLSKVERSECIYVMENQSPGHTDDGHCDHE